MRKDHSASFITAHWKEARWWAARFGLWLILAGWASLGHAQVETLPDLREPQGAALGTLDRILPDFENWKNRINRLPMNIELNGSPPPKNLLPLKSFQEFKPILDAYLAWNVRENLSQRVRWEGEKPDPSFWDIERAYFSDPKVPFQPFVEKLVVEPGAKAVFHGDFHGDVHSLIHQLEWLNQQRYLQGFKIRDPDFFLIYLGDYTDRGRYGLEVVYTLLCLKLANPDQVFMVRGNHEDFQLTMNYGFTQEIEDKYGRDFDFPRFWRLYDFLPVALYFGCRGDFIQVCHGGMELGYEPGKLLSHPNPRARQRIDRLNRRDTFVGGALERWVHPPDRSMVMSHIQNFQAKSPTLPSPLGFMWNDFTLLGSEPGLGYNPGRSMVFGESVTRWLLKRGSGESYRLRAVFRAHQHSSVRNPMMERLLASDGVFRHWQENDHDMSASGESLGNTLEVHPIRKLVEGSVWTFNVAPDSVYGVNLGFTHDTYGLLSVESSFEDWRLEVIQQQTRPRP